MTDSEIRLQCLKMAVDLELIGHGNDAIHEARRLVDFVMSQPASPAAAPEPTVRWSVAAHNTSGCGWMGAHKASECRPPAGTKAMTYHWLVAGSGNGRAVRYWDGGAWYFGEKRVAPEDVTSWRYVAEVIPPEPQAKE